MYRSFGAHPSRSTRSFVRRLLRKSSCLPSQTLRPRSSPLCFCNHSQTYRFHSSSIPFIQPSSHVQFLLASSHLSSSAASIADESSTAPTKQTQATFEEYTFDRKGCQAYLAALITRLEEKQALHKDLMQFLHVADRLGNTFAKRVEWAMFGGLCVQFGVLFQWVFFMFDWNLVEPMTYFLAYSNIWFGIMFYATTGCEFNYDATRECIAKWRRERYIASHVNQLENSTLLRMIQDRKPEHHQQVMEAVRATQQTLAADISALESEIRSIKIAKQSERERK